jgi:hypothetical protein
MKEAPMTDQAVFCAECACGRVAFEATGSPISTLACYCDDCYAAATQIAALPGGQSGMGADGGTLSALYRRDRVRCVRGKELLREHKLRPSSPTTRLFSACCHCSMTARFDNWFPQLPLRSYAPSAVPLVPELCMFTKFARAPADIAHPAPRHASVSPGLVLKLALAAAGLWRSR